MSDLKEGRSHEPSSKNHPNPNEFEALCREHYSYVFRLISKIILNEEIAKELTQDTFMHAARSIQTFRGASSFQTWVCTIAVHQANGHLRKICTARKHQEHLHLQRELKRQPSDPRESLFYKEELERVSLAMEQLEPDLRTALVCTVMEGMDASEVAKIQGCSRATLYWRVHQARKQLKEALNHAE